MPLARQLQNLGMPLYGMQPPTGYSMKSDTWVNSSALLGRMNFSLALMAGRIKGVQVDAEAVLNGGAVDNAGIAGRPDAQRTLAILETSLLAGQVSKQTHDAILKQLETASAGGGNNQRSRPTANAATISALLLGSPEFQNS